MRAKQLLGVLLGIGLMSTSVPVVFAEDLDVKIDKMKIQEDKEDIAEDRANVSKWEQVVKEREAARNTAKDNYEMNLKKSGAKAKLTKESKERYEAAQRSLQRAERKVARARESLREDEIELAQAYQELEKSRQD